MVAGSSPARGATLNQFIKIIQIFARGLDPRSHIWSHTRLAEGRSKNFSEAGRAGGVGVPQLVPPERYGHPLGSSGQEVAELQGLSWLAISCRRAHQGSSFSARRIPIEFCLGRLHQGMRTTVKRPLPPSRRKHGFDSRWARQKLKTLALILRTTAATYGNHAEKALRGNLEVRSLLRVAPRPPSDRDTFPSRHRSRRRRQLAGSTACRTLPHSDP
jgi:hypothetical protein